MKKFIAPVLVGLLLSTAAFAAPDTKVKEIDVTLDITAVTNPAAALRYAAIADDLKNAITAQLVDRTDEKGVSINIDLSEVELSNSFSELVGSADTRLVGDVKISSLTDKTEFKTYELTVDVNQAKVFFPATVDLTKLTANSDEFYQAMIQAYADGVVKRLNE
jgi:hypothetical protein